jgi:CHAT domain-containing protein
MGTFARVIFAVWLIAGAIRAEPRPPEAGVVLDRVAAALDRGDLDAAQSDLSTLEDVEFDAADPRARRLLGLRLRAAVWRGRFDVAAELDAALAALPVDATFAGEVAFARAEFQRSRPQQDAERQRAALSAAEALYGASLEGATSLQRAIRLEWRGNVRTRLRAVHAADGDFRAAEAVFRALGEARSAARCLRRRATNLAVAGDPRLALRVLARHQAELERIADAGLLPELRDSVHLAAVLAVRCDDLDLAESTFERQRALDAGLQAGLTLNDMLFWSDRAQRLQSDLVLELAHLAMRRPADEERALALAETVVDHLQATTLSTALRRSNAARGIERATTTPEVDADVARLRLFCAVPHDAPAELVVMYRHRERFALRSLGRCDAIEAEADRFLEQWFAPDGLRGAAADYARDAFALFASLCGPVADAFADPAVAPRRLVLLVNGPLEGIPFEALVTAPTTAASFAALPYVVRSTSVLRVPALSTLRALPAPNAADRAVAVLDPQLNDARLPRLVHARGEATALCKAHRDCEILEGPMATLPRLRAALRRAPTGWLHLACHAEWTRADQRRAVLRLAPGAGLDGRLDLERVAGADDPLQLTPGVRVVLSGCGTALGPLRPGEGMLGLWRAFLFRGASCVISTLRPVDDRAGAAWMAAFHRHGANLPAADAARAASLDWLDGTARPRFPRGFAATDTAHPQLWAIAIVVGNDGGPLP